MNDPDDLTIPRLLDAYRTGATTPREVMQRLLAQDDGDRRVWITRLDAAEVMEFVASLNPAAVDRLPLYGIPFVIKDNIDLAGVPTTAGCPGFAHTPSESATVVRRLIDAGAIPLGKTNLDQFATGLVGVRSPYGACRNSIDRNYVSGGSSSGSAVAVATGAASFSLGTDTAGSGRVPAAFNNIVGLKPSNGRVSTRGVVPACRSLDCVSIFALTAADAACVLDAATDFDPGDPFSRPTETRDLRGLRFGVPHRDQLRFFGDADYERLFDDAARRLETMGGRRVTIDFEPFLATARLLYEGPWVAERYAAVGAFIAANPRAVHPITRQIIEGGRQPSAVAAFEAQYRLKALQRLTMPTWEKVDFIVTPTAGTIYRVDEVEGDPLGLNSNLGYYTNFMNLLDLAGVAVPAGRRGDGLPFGVTLVGPRGTDHDLLRIAGRLHHAGVATLGALTFPVPQPAASSPAASPPGSPRQDASEVFLAVCGAHMQGLPLNRQLRDLGGRFVRAARTAPCYRLYALPGGPPHRPGLVRVGDAGGAIEVETWALPAAQVGSFLAGIPSPLGIGRIELESGERQLGFLCEAYAAQGAADITHHGGWRTYLGQTGS